MENETEQQNEQPKARFIIELEQFYLDGDKIQDALRSGITREVKKQIMDEISKKVEREITEIVKAEMKSTVSARIDAIVREVSRDIKIKPRYSSDEMPLRDAIADEFKHQNEFTKNVESFIATEAKKFGKQMRERFDLQFATHVVKNMQENNLLREGVAGTLLEEKNGGNDEE